MLLFLTFLTLLATTPAMGPSQVMTEGRPGLGRPRTRTVVTEVCRPGDMDYIFTILHQAHRTPHTASNTGLVSTSKVSPLNTIHTTGSNIFKCHILYFFQYTHLQHHHIYIYNIILFMMYFIIISLFLFLQRQCFHVRGHQSRVFDITKYYDMN